MHLTKIVTKKGKVFTGVIVEWRPSLGFMVLDDGKKTVKIRFDDMKSAVTHGERVAPGKTGDMDDLERARQYMRKAREHGWDGLSPDSPLRKWEVSNKFSAWFSQNYPKPACDAFVGYLVAWAVALRQWNIMRNAAQAAWSQAEVEVKRSSRGLRRRKIA